MDPVTRSRDPETEQLERDTFTLLRHARDASGADPEVALQGADVSARLGLEPEYAARIFRYLAREGMLSYDDRCGSVSITFPGIAYVDSLAWRRRTVRPRWT